MITWQEGYEDAQSIAGDEEAATLTFLKKNINRGAHRFNSALNRYFTRRAKTANIEDGVQYYQLPPDAIRVIKVRAKQASSENRYPLKQIRSEDEWDALNTTNQRGNWATYFFQRGSDEIGIFPIPSSNITAGLEISYEPRDRDLSQDDYTTGTITVTNGSTTVTGSGTTFTSAMIGRVLKVTDGSGGYWYRVGAFTDPVTITLEEPYMDTSGSAKTFKIGETFLFPEEYQDAPIDYALSRFFEMRQNPERAVYHLSRYNESLGDAKEKYASSSSSLVITDGVEGFNTWLISPDPVTGI